MTELNLKLATKMQKLTTEKEELKKVLDRIKELESEL